jgi:hypothetical protein
MIWSKRPLQAHLSENIRLLAHQTKLKPHFLATTSPPLSLTISRRRARTGWKVAAEDRAAANGVAKSRKRTSRHSAKVASTMATVVDIVDEVADAEAIEDEGSVGMASQDVDEGVTEAVAIRRPLSSNSHLDVI